MIARPFPATGPLKDSKPHSKSALVGLQIGWKRHRTTLENPADAWRQLGDDAQAQRALDALHRRMPRSNPR